MSDLLHVGSLRRYLEQLSPSFVPWPLPFPCFRTPVTLSQPRVYCCNILLMHMQRIDGTRFGYGSDTGHLTTPDDRNGYDPPQMGYAVNSPGHAVMTCPGMALPLDFHECRTQLTSVAPNMWDTNHKLYSVWQLQEDRVSDTFIHKCVDAEFPHFPYAHYVEFSMPYPLVHKDLSTARTINNNFNSIST